MKKNITNKVFTFILLTSIISSCSNESINNTENNIETNNIETNNIDSNNTKLINDNSNNDKIIEQNSLVWQIHINNTCIWCWKCISIAPSNFWFNNSIRKAEVISQENINSSSVQRAISSCPTRSIEIL